MSQGIDKRIIRSRKALLCALPAILADKPLERVTVREIAEAAGINRKTFYAHYATPTELHDDLANEIVSGVIRRMGDRAEAHPADFVAAVAGLARDYREEFTFILQLNHLNELRTMVFSQLTSALASRLFPNSDRSELLAASLIGSTLGLYTANLTSPTPLSLPALEEFQLNYISRGLT